MSRMLGVAICLLPLMCFTLALADGPDAPADPVAEALATARKEIALQHYAKAYDAYTRAMTAQEQATNTDDPALIPLLTQRAEASRLQGQFPQAETDLFRALDLDDHAVTPDLPRTQATLLRLQMLYQQQQLHAKCLPIQQRLITVTAKLQGEQSPILIPLYLQLAALHVTLRHFPEAEVIVQQALTRQEAVNGKEDPGMLIPLGQQVDCFMAEKKFSDATTTLQRMITLGQQVYGETDPRLLPIFTRKVALVQAQGDTAQVIGTLKGMVALGANNPDVPVSQTQQYGLQLAEAYRVAKDREAAIATFDQLVAFIEKRCGKTDPALLPVLYAQCAHDLVNDAGKDAKPRYLRALAIGDADGHSSAEQRLTVFQHVADLAIKNADLGTVQDCEARATALATTTTTPAVLTTLLTIATAYQSHAYTKQAEATLQNALTLGAKVLGEQDARLLPFVQQVVRVYLAQGAPDKADAPSQRLLTLTEAARGATSPALIEAWQTRADVLAAAKQPAKAEEALLHALTLAEGQEGAPMTYRFPCLMRLASFYSTQHAPDQAAVMYRRAVTLQETAQGKDNTALCPSLLAWATALCAAKQTPEAEAVLTRVATLVDRAPAPDIIGNALLKLQIADGYQQVQQYPKAAALVQAALTAVERENGPTSPTLVPFLMRAAAIAKAQGQADAAEKYQARITALSAAKPHAPDR